MFATALPSDDWSKPTIKSRVVTKIPKETRNQTEYEEDDDQDTATNSGRMDRFKKFSYENEPSDDTQTKRRLSKKIRKPQVYPIDDHPIDDDCFILNKSTSSSASGKKSSATDGTEDSTLKLNDSQSTIKEEAREEAPANILDKSIKNIVNKYEVKQPPSKATDSVSGQASAALSNAPAESKRINKLPKNIVDMFNSNKKEATPDTTSVSSLVAGKTPLLKSSANETKKQTQLTAKNDAIKAESDKINVVHEDSAKPSTDKEAANSQAWV